MITEEQAERIASEFAGQRQDVGWALTEFDAGWLVEASPSEPPRRGTSALVIERESGRVMRFPSSVSADRILNEYAEIVDRGYAQDRPGPHGPA